MIIKYNKFFERVDDDTWEGDWEEIQSEFQDLQHNFDEYDNKDAYDSYREDGGEDFEGDEDMEHLKYLLRSMFKNKGFDSISITNDGLDISIRCILAYREKLSDVVSLFDIINKLKSDILPQYECEFDMWYNKQGQTLEFNFLNDDSDYGSSDEEDEDEEGFGKPF